MHGFVRVNTVLRSLDINCKVCCSGSFGIGYTNGGPVSIIWGWIICSGMSFCVAACMAEITSSLPISGGPYYWCGPLALLPVASGRCNSPHASFSSSCKSGMF